MALVSIVIVMETRPPEKMFLGFSSSQAFHCLNTVKPLRKKKFDRTCVAPGNVNMGTNVSYWHVVKKPLSFVACLCLRFLFTSLVELQINNLNKNSKIQVSGIYKQPHSTRILDFFLNGSEIQ